jgi:putative addiction module component (TIGR02574 family)
LNPPKWYLARRNNSGYLPLDYRMTAIAKNIEEQIQRLPLEDKPALHEHLIVSIHESEAARNLDPAFRTEIQRRVDENDSGKVQGTDAFEALAKM